jgi:hypothetical protein
VGLGVADVDGEQHGLDYLARRRSQRTDPLDALALEGGEGGAQRRPVRQDEHGIELQQGDEHEAPSRDVGVGQGEPLRVVLELSEQQQVDVDRARGVTLGAGLAAERALDALAEVEQRLGLERGLDLEAGVDELALADGSGLGLGLVRRGGGEDARAAGRLGPVQELARRAQAFEALALVRAEAQEASPRRSAQSARSLWTATATSSTGKAIGGSGLATRTEIWSTP